MSKKRYDTETDSLYLEISPKKAYLTFEVNDKIGVDLTKSNIPVGVEILEASQLLSSLFNQKVSRESIKNVLCEFFCLTLESQVSATSSRTDREDEYYLKFRYNKENAVFALPLALLFDLRSSLCGFAADRASLDAKGVNPKLYRSPVLGMS